MKLLILGSEGFIGSHLVARFSRLGWQVEGCDLSEYHAPGYRYYKQSVLSPDFESMFASGDYDVVINASGSGNVGYSVQHPYSDFESNSIVVARVLDVIRKYRPSCRLLQFSSAAVYGNPARLPVSETDPLQPLSPYGYHKLISEELCSAYHRLYGLPVAVLRPFSVYGNGLMKQLLWDICCRMQEQKEVRLFGTGNETRDFIHISDLMQAVEKVISGSSFQMDIYNVAAGNEVAVKTMAGLLIKHYGVAYPLSFTGEIKAGDPLHWKADISRLQSLGFTPAMPLEQGVEEYVAWFRRRQPAD